MFVSIYFFIGLLFLLYVEYLDKTGIFYTFKQKTIGQLCNAIVFSVFIIATWPFWVFMQICIYLEVPVSKIWNYKPFVKKEGGK
jgi:hypothetical protein